MDSGAANNELVYNAQAKFQEFENAVEKFVMKIEIMNQVESIPGAPGPYLLDPLETAAATSSAYLFQTRVGSASARLTISSRAFPQARMNPFGM